MFGLNGNERFSEYNSYDIDDLFRFLDSWVIYYRNQLDFDDNVTVGVEIEFDEAELCKVKEIMEEYNFRLPKLHMWIAKGDKSIDYNEIIGGEVTSLVRNTDEFFFEELKKVTEYIKRVGGSASDKTGGHIHFGSQIIDDEIAWSNLLKTWLIYEKVIYRFGYGDNTRERTGLYEHAKPLTRSIIHLNDLIRTLKAENIGYEDIDYFLDSSRRYGINFKNVTGNLIEERNTVEIRCPNGTLNPIIWQNNINFFGRLLLRMNSIDSEALNYKFKHYKSDSKIEDYHKIDVKLALELCDMLFDNNLDKLNFLKQYFKNFETKNKQIVLTK